ncbi:phage major capsid protein [Solidesulfovibrio alcoholivorans]|uniref:phage major capsid protein n=1 Tax=Solidesulfovibrio alcoholivorans TaxID=81406 RepID=UPI000694A0EF|nr:phage major capsid protein [Solidesulfovibrio alcoholivorans]
MLVHDQNAVDLSRAPLPLIVGHDPAELPVGVVEGLRVEGGRLRGSLRFSEGIRGQEILADVKAGILRNLSVGYVVQATERGQGDSYRVTKWQPYECSLVACPADPSVGIGRSFNPNTPQEGKTMDMNDIKREQTRCMKELEALAASGDDTESLAAKRAELADLDTRLAVLDDLAKRRGPADKVPGIGAPAGAPAIREGEVRVLAPGDKLADTCRRDLVDGIKPEELSLGRVLRGLVTGDWSGAEAEKRSVMSEGTSSLGGVLIPAPMAAQVIDLARNQAVVFRAGASTVPMTANTLKMCKVTGDMSASWREENAAITASEMSFDSLSFTAKALAAICSISIELLEDAGNVNGLIENSIAQALALELDRAALFGSGVAPEPLGLNGVVGVQSISMGDNGAALTGYSPFTLAMQKLYEKNAIPGSFVFSPRTWAAMEGLVDTTGQPLAAPASFASAPKLVSNQIPNTLHQGTATNASSIFTGAWSNLMVGMRTSLTLEASRVAGADAFSKMQVMIRAYLRCDVQVARPDHFVKIVGVIPA